MRFVQFLKDDCHRRVGVLSEDGTQLKEIAFAVDMVSFIRQNMSMPELEKRLENVAFEDITDSHIMLPPITKPDKIICIAFNYKDHCEETDVPLPSEPVFFSKFNTALVGPKGDIIAHKITNEIDWEVELAVIIGKKAKNVPLKEAMDYVFGYTIAQDITARDWQMTRNGGQFLIGKSMDTFCPLGPEIVHKSLIKNINALDMECKVNGEVKQSSNTSQMIFKIDYIIHTLSQCITLKAGDVILTGTPHGVGMTRDPPEFLKVGDVVESYIEGLGNMVNKVVAPGSS